MTDRDASHPLTLPIGVAGQLVGLAGLAMPAVGVAMRLLAFSLGKLEFSAAAATASPVPQLAIAGISSTFIFILESPVLFALVKDVSARYVLEQRIEALDEALLEAERNDVSQNDAVLEQRELLATARKEISDRRRGKYPRFTAVLASAVLILVCVATSGFPSQLINLLGLAVGTAVLLRSLARSPNQTITLGTAWPAVLALLVTCVVASSITGALTRFSSADFEMRSGSPIPSGEYVSVGDDGTFLYLISCAPPHPQLAVRKDDVTAIRYASHRGGIDFDTSLVGLIRQGDWPTWGVRLECR